MTRTSSLLARSFDEGITLRGSVRAPKRRAFRV